MPVPVDISAWKPAPFAVEGETIFAVGDVHGCADELRTLLDAVGTSAAECPVGKRRLVFLGDMVDRGPDTIGALRLWSAEAREHGVDRIDRIIGNHEIMMLLAGEGGPSAPKYEAMWLAGHSGGRAALEEMRTACQDPAAPPSHALFVSALGEGIVRQLLTQRSHLRIGNTLFIHGGLDPKADQATFLATPWTAGREARWAWINRGFLDWQGGFGGTLVVHGHTPPAKHFPLTHMADPHLFLHDRLGLDGGSAVTGLVVGAEIQDGRYRIFKAGKRRAGSSGIP
ncbi:serine/threonine protein phosphatase 1 [Enhydrobacter aerosaccus]|uniref:Serine/threonine protein phosphatase 1 n=1 Tax=Enhydrobacter aerosaccus TaxID=225324 RepID=A0A1T4PRQ7_9HYPH|nr:metallophosphoesterase [Enhydrobacter aerosaccus]SJZ93877.1 serine/threonine protein phosphatase 1 [Enhydrobacter aerosaccus]